MEYNLLKKEILSLIAATNEIEPENITDLVQKLIALAQHYNALAQMDMAHSASVMCHRAELGL